MCSKDHLRCLAISKPQNCVFLVNFYAFASDYLPKPFYFRSVRPPVRQSVSVLDCQSYTNSLRTRYLMTACTNFTKFATFYIGAVGEKDERLIDVEV